MTAEIAHSHASIALNKKLWSLIDINLREQIEQNVSDGRFDLHADIYYKDDIDRLTRLGYEVIYNCEYNDYTIKW